MEKANSIFRLKGTKKLLTIPYFAVNAIINPKRADMVAGLGDVTGEKSLKRMLLRMKSSEVGSSILRLKPVISSASINLPRLRALPDGTLGKEYSNFMESHGFIPDERPAVRFVEDSELAYVMLRYRQIHDFWHILSGLPPTILGEIALKWLEWVVTGFPVCGLSSIVGPIRLSSDDQYKLTTVYIPWAIKNGRSCDDLMSFRYEDHFDKPLEDVRILLNFTPAPSHNSP